MSTLPAALRRSLTWDQGKEMAEHVRFTVDSGNAGYLCDPSASWQRGTNENTFGLLRQYFPKGTDLTLFDHADLDAVADELNDRPRQTLNWMKPSEAYNQRIDSVRLHLTMRSRRLSGDWRIDRWARRRNRDEALHMRRDHAP